MSLRRVGLSQFASLGIGFVSGRALPVVVLGVMMMGCLAAPRSLVRQEVLLVNKSGRPIVATMSLGQDGSTERVRVELAADGRVTRTIRGYPDESLTGQLSIESAADGADVSSRRLSFPQRPFRDGNRTWEIWIQQSGDSIGFFGPVSRQVPSENGRN